jgi:hypothetical protein
VIGDVSVRGFGIKATQGRKFYMSESQGGDDDGLGQRGGSFAATEGSNRLYVGMLIMLIFSEALALYGLIVALILSQNMYVCG